MAATRETHVRRGEADAPDQGSPATCGYREPLHQPQSLPQIRLEEKCPPDANCWPRPARGTQRPGRGKGGPIPVEARVAYNLIAYTVVTTASARRRGRNPHAARLEVHDDRRGSGMRRRPGLRGRADHPRRIA